MHASLSTSISCAATQETKATCGPKVQLSSAAWLSSRGFLARNERDYCKGCSPLKKEKKKKKKKISTAILLDDCLHRKGVEEWNKPAEAHRKPSVVSETSMYRLVRQL
jgi:hypothetical protein